MKKANTRTKDICEQLGVPKRTFCDWVRQAKDAGTWLDIPGRVLRPAPHKKATGTITMNTKITKQVKLKMKRLVMANPFLTAKGIMYAQSGLDFLVRLTPISWNRFACENSTLTSKLGLESHPNLKEE